MSDEQQAEDKRLRSAALDTAVRELTGYAVLAALSWCLLNRDAVARMWAALRHRPVTPQQAREMREVAALRRAVSTWEHAQAESPATGSGRAGG
jgi:hypothetical protein